MRGVMMVEDQAVTESWKKEEYEDSLTELHFETVKSLKEASRNPTIEALMAAHADVNAFLYALITSPFYLKSFPDVENPLKEIELALHGSQEDPGAIIARAEYGVEIGVDRFGHGTVTNGQNIVRRLWGLFKIIQTWAYKQGFFAKKPRSKQYGRAAIEAAMKM